MIEEYMPIGYENAINRGELRELTGLRDDTMRQEIRELAKKYPVVCVQGKGYFVPDFNKPEDIHATICYMKQLKSRAYKELARARFLEGMVSEYIDKVENKFRSARLLSSKTQKEVCEATGISIPEISKIENGRMMPTEEQLCLLSEFYGVEL